MEPIKLEWPNEGLHYGIPFSTYLRTPILSQSVLKEGRKSMAHLAASMKGEVVRKVTDDMALGSALHTCFLEPELMPKRVVCWTGAARRGAAWDEFSAEHADKVILTEGYYDKLIGMVAKLRKHKQIREWQSRIEAVEVSAIGRVHGVLFKGRCDALTPDPLFDLKKVQSTDPRLVAKTVYGFGYHIQAATYRRLFNRERFILACVEGTAPYDVVTFELSDDFLAIGDAAAEELIGKVRDCMKTDVWPGRSDDIVRLDPPTYALGDAEDVVFGDESAFS